MACLKDLVESSPAKNTAFSQKVIVSFIFFNFVLSESNMEKKKEGEKEKKYFLTAHKFSLPLNIISHAEQQVINSYFNYLV